MRRRWAAAAVVLALGGGVLALAGGGAASAAVTAIEWRQAASQPYGNSEGQAVVVGDRLWSFGGFDATLPCCTPTKRVYVYDPAANTWTRRADLPRGLTHAGIATDGTDIFLAGGYASKLSGEPGQVFGTREVWRYSPATNSYSALPSFDVPLAAGGLAYLDGKLHWLGGTDLARTQDLDVHLVLDLAAGATEWVPAPPLPAGRTHFATVVLDGRIWVLGGQQEHDAELTPHGDMWVYDPATGQWTARSPLSPPRNHHGNSTTVVDGRILVMGGQVGHEETLRLVEQYDPATDRWTRLTSLPQARHSAVGGYVGGELLFSTGNRDARSYRGHLVRDGVVPDDTVPPPVEPDDPPSDGGHGHHPGHATSRFVPAGPVRVLDTREGAAAARVGSGQSVRLPVASRAGAPASATAVVVNLTATEGEGPGFVQALPAGVAPGGASSLNVERAGQTVANAAVVPLGAGGALDLYVQTATHLVVDVLGWFVPADTTAQGRYLGRSPERVLDTRTGLGVPGVATPRPSGDQHKLGPAGHLRLELPGVPADAVAVALNVTATEASADGFVQVVPAGGGVLFGSSSNLNPRQGQTVANLVLSSLRDRAVELFSQSGTHLVVDLLGYVTGPSAATSDKGLYVPVDPARLLDTRGGPTPGAGALVDVPVTGRAGVPTSGVGAVAANVTATEALAPGFVQAGPTDVMVWGGSSTLNVEHPGQTLANAAFVQLGRGGSASLGTQSGTHLLLDVTGWFTN